MVFVTIKMSIDERKYSQLDELDIAVYAARRNTLYKPCCIFLTFALFLCSLLHYTTSEERGKEVRGAKLFLEGLDEQRKVRTVHVDFSVCSVLSLCAVWYDCVVVVYGACAGAVDACVSELLCVQY